MKTQPLFTPMSSISGKMEIIAIRYTILVLIFQRGQIKMRGDYFYNRKYQDNGDNAYVGIGQASREPSEQRWLKSEESSQQ